MCKTVSETIALIEKKRTEFDWHCKTCGGQFGNLQLWENHSPKKECEADRHWYYYVCRKCGVEISVKNLIADTYAGIFTKTKTFMEELAEYS